MTVRDYILDLVKILIPSGFMGWVGYLSGRKKSGAEADKLKAEAESAEADAASKRQKLYNDSLDTLRAVREEAQQAYNRLREIEARHNDALRIIAEREARLIEVNATLAARDSVIANLKLESASNLKQTEATLRQTANIRADVEKIGDMFNRQLQGILERLERIEQSQITTAEKAERAE